VVHCVLGAVAVWLVYRIGRRAYGARVGLLAAAAYAVFPPAVRQSTELASEPLGVLLFLVFLDAALAFASRPTWVRAALTGCVLGLALLTRSNYVVMIPLFALWFLWQFRGRWNHLMLGFSSLAFAALVLTPWVVRNYRVFGEFVPLSTTGGSALLQGNNDVVVTDPKLYGYSVWDTQLPGYREALQSAGNEVERDRRAKAFAIAWLRD